VRIGANGGAGIDPLDAHSGPVIFTRHGIDDITWCYRAARHDSFPSFRRARPQPPRNTKEHTMTNGTSLVIPPGDRAWINARYMVCEMLKGRLAGKDRESQAANGADGIKDGFAR
jgi:hypothetical protein